uniref:RNA-directed DNA polymerase n=1 Tax=Strigamia maritima TaxID=126957 RepID=T1IRS9_STRMM
MKQIDDESFYAFVLRYNDLWIQQDTVTPQSAAFDIFTNVNQNGKNIINSTGLRKYENFNTILTRVTKQKCIYNDSDPNPKSSVVEKKEEFKQKPHFHRNHNHKKTHESMRNLEINETDLESVLDKFGRRIESKSTIGGLTYNALIDSGATQCFIGEHMLTKTGCLPDYIQEAPPNMKVCAVGIEHTPVGQITLCIKWYKQLTPMNFFILPKRVCSLIIGHNFMRRLHLNMHPGKGYFSCTRIPGLIVPYVSYSEGFREASLETIFVYNTELSQDPNWDEKLLTGSNCTAEQRLALKEVLTSVKGVFSDKPGCFDGCEHHIKFKDGAKITKNPYRIRGGGREEQDQTLYSALTDLLNEIPPTREELIEAQLKDEFCLRIRNYLLSKDNEKKELNKPPNWMERIGGYMLDSKESTNKDGLLIYFNPTFDKELNDSGNGFKAVVPRSLIRRVMFACHGHSLSGHAGISKTIHRTKQIYYWSKMSRHIRVYVRSCQHCQQYKPNQISEALGHTPMLLNLGREAPLPFDPRILYHGISLDKNRPEDYVKDLLGVLSRAHQNMYHKIQKNYERHEKVHNDKYHICEYELGDLVWKKTHILPDKDNNITKGLAVKRDGPWEITKIHGGDLLPYIPSYPIEEWEENQLVGTNEEHTNPEWMSQIEKNNIQEDITAPTPVEATTQVEQTNSSTPGVKTQGRHHKKHLKREAKPPDRKPRTRKPNTKYIDGFVTKVDLNNQSTTMSIN